MATVDPHAGTRVLVTGATGFVGQALCVRLAELGYAVRRATRKAPADSASGPFDTVPTGELGADTDWSPALAGVSIVFHLAARTHVVHETSDDPYAEFHRINVAGTRSLAQAAIRTGVRRMVFLSSIKVNGERTDAHPFTEAASPQPEDDYGITKWEAEQVLFTVARDSGFETVILRPPLVYGPGVKGNFLRLMHWIARGVPLPLASITNRRSVIYVDNLVDAIVAAGLSAAAAGRTYLVADNEDVSTPVLIRSMADAMQARSRLFPFPRALLMAAAAATGKREEMRRLTGSLQVDSSKIRGELEWTERFRLAQGLAQTAQWYYSQFPEKSNT